MKEIAAKHILSPYKAVTGWFGLNYNMNLYRGCCHGCIYCDSRSSCYGIENFDEVCVKKDALKLLETDLQRLRKKGVVGTGAMTDSYHPFEKELCVTQGALKLLNKYGFGVHIITKSDLVVRDKEILTEIAQHSPVSVTFTITTKDDELCKKLEPYAPPTHARLLAIKELSEAGITTGVILTPTLPFVNDTKENIEGILKAAAAAGAKYAYTFKGFGVTLRQNQRDYFLEKIEKLYPTMRKKYVDTYGSRYVCLSPQSNMLWQVFVKKCKELGLAYQMEDIITLTKAPYQKEQLKMF